MPTYDISETEKIEASIEEHLRNTSPEALSNLASSFGISDVSSAGEVSPDEKTPIAASAGSAGQPPVSPAPSLSSGEASGSALAEKTPVSASALIFGKTFLMSMIKSERTIPDYIQKAMSGIAWNGWMGDVSDGSNCNKIACIYSLKHDDIYVETHFYFCFGRVENPSVKETCVEPHLQFWALVANCGKWWLMKEFLGADLEMVKDTVNREHQNAVSVLGLDYVGTELLASANSFQQIFSMARVKNPDKSIPLYLHNYVWRMPYAPGTEGWFGNSSVGEDCNTLVYFFNSWTDNFFVFGREKSLKESPLGDKFKFRALLVQLEDSDDWYSGSFSPEDLERVILAVNKGKVVSELGLSKTDVHNALNLISNVGV